MPNVVVYTLATLTAAIISECEEDATFSTLFVAQIPNFIRRGESRVYGDLNLEMFDRVSTGQLTISVKPQPIRAMSWQQIRALFIRATLLGSPTGPRIPVLRRSYDFCAEYDGDDPTASGPPPYFSELDETNIFVALRPDQAYHYEAHIVRNNDTQSLNNVSPTWLSTNMGDILLFACVIEALRWLEADQAEMDVYEKAYVARLLMDKTTLRESMRAGDYTPLADSAKTVSDSQ